MVIYYSYLSWIYVAEKSDDSGNSEDCKKTEILDDILEESKNNSSGSGIFFKN